jgi:RNA polymerase sigma factor (sigma-70 family)
MKSERRSSIGGPLRTLWTVGTVGASDDLELLSRFARRQDGADDAFRVLIERHGPMVLHVCRQVLGEEHDAEDAAQAVFLVLAGKAGSIRVTSTVAPWLHGVARRVAAKARGRSAARRQVEMRAAIAAASVRDHAGDESPEARDWEAIHEAVERLPDKYRTPVVLCYLQGQTYEEAAKRIGCPVGTVRVRLSRARQRLRDRLTRRGLGPEPTAAVGWLAPGSGAILPPAAISTTKVLPGGAAWVDATVSAARAVGLGQAAMAGAVSASVLYLYRGAVRTMMMNAWKSAAVWLLAGTMTIAGAIAVAAGGPSGQEKGTVSKAQPAAAAPAKTPPPQPPVDLDAPDSLRKQTERRVNAARQRLDAQRAYYDEGRITIDRFIDASEQLMLAEIAASATREGRMAAAKANMDRIGEIVKREQAELEKGRGTVADVAEALVAHETAACEYLEIRQSRGSLEIEALKKRVETLEKQVAIMTKVAK